MDEFRAALRKIGAPDWWPDNAPRHKTNGLVEQDVYKFSCPECGWERHFVGDDMLVIHEGDPWAIHSGSTMPGFLEITGVTITDPNLDIFQDHFDNLEGLNDG